MSVGVVTEFEHEGHTYDIPTDKDERREFAEELASKLEALDGIESAVCVGSTHSWDSVRFEIIPETTERHGLVRLLPDPRSLSPRIRNTFEEFAPTSSFEVLYTPEPIDAENDVYDNTLYIAEAWFY